MKKKLLFAFAALLAALSLPAAAQESLELPDVQPVEGGITIVAHIPEGTDCFGAPLWGGEDNFWSGKLMEAVEGAEGWYKTNIAATSTQGKMLANFEGWENSLGNWHTQWKEIEILESTVLYEYTASSWDDIIRIDSEGIIYISVKSWRQNPCILDREFKFTIVVPDCTPEGQETVNIVGGFDEDPDTEGVQSWNNGMDFPIVGGKAEITITGQETTEWKVRLTNDWSQQAVHWGYYEYEDRFTVISDYNRTLGEAEGKEIYIQGWGDTDAPLGDCLADMPTVTDMALSKTELRFVLNNLPTEPVSITAMAVVDGSITDITELCEWSSSDETVATVENGKVSIVGGKGSAVITCDYYGLERTLFVNVYSIVREVTVKLPACTPTDGNVLIEGSPATVDWETMTATATVFGEAADEDIVLYIQYYPYNSEIRYFGGSIELVENENGEKYYVPGIGIALPSPSLGEYDGEPIEIDLWFGLGYCEGEDRLPLSLSMADAGKYDEEGRLVLVMGTTCNLSATFGDEDVNATAQWSSSDESVAEIFRGVVFPNAEGTATITCTYREQVRKVDVVVKAPFDFSTLLQGDEYYIFQMDDETFAELDAAGKVVSDMRCDGEFDAAGNIVPEDANRIYYPWNTVTEEIADAPQTGLNAFGKAEEWFSIASADPTPQGGWGNICGGLGIGTPAYPASSDAEVAKLQDLTPEHEFVVVLKGGYTITEYLTIQLFDATGMQHDALVVERSTGDCLDGGWEAFSFTYPELLAMGIDLSRPVSEITWYPFAYIAYGAGNRVDIDAVFFYIPEETEVSAIEENDADADNTDIKVTAANGRIYCEYPFTVINLAGQDVTALNGSLQGTYIVLAEGQAVKVSVN